ncbi:MAG: LysR family transcriptional regulator [Lachnospiraceae bacterium]
MDTKYLNYILEIDRQRNITKAANILYVSQSSLSQYLSKLEAEIGAPLFTRTKNELIPTAAGQLYIEAAKSVIQIQKQLYQNVSSLSQTGQIHVGISSQWGIEMMTDILPDFKRKFPHITVKIRESQYDRQVQLLTAGKLDMSVMAVTDLEAFPFDYQMLRQEEILFAVPADHHFATSHSKQNEITVPELIRVFRQESFILSSEGSTLRQATDRMLLAHYFNPISVCEVNSNMAAIRLVEKKVGTAFIPPPTFQTARISPIFPCLPGCTAIMSSPTAKVWSSMKQKAA